METGLYFFWSGVTLSVFYFFYLLLLRRETFFMLNRFYLLLALGFSLVIPLLNLSAVIGLPEVELMTSAFSVTGGEKLRNIAEREWNWLAVIYQTGVVCSVVWFLIRLLGVKKQMKLTGRGAAFSFWKTMVIDQELKDVKVIDAHEKVHIKQFHTLDILIIELVTAFFWFNPVIYYYRRSLKFIHEYLADEQASRFAGSKKQYAMVLFLQNFRTGPALSNTFYNASMLESRIRMLQRERSGSGRLWKYTLCIPLIVVLTIFCSFSSGRGKADQPASFPGGFEAFSKYLIKTSEKVSNDDGVVVVSFVVETDGRISNEKVESSLDEASDKEALRVIGTSPRWIPALQEGEKVRSAYQIKLNFKSDNQTLK